MSDKIEVTRKYVQDLTPASLLADNHIREHIITKFCAIFQTERSKAMAFYEREKDNFAKRVSENADLRSCTTMSIFMGLAQVFGWKLSLEPGGQSDVYLMPGNVNVGTKENPIFEKQMAAVPSPYGEKKIRIETGQVKHVDSPVVVYDVDHYIEHTDEKGGLVVEWRKGKRTVDSKIIGSFIRIEKPNGTFEFKTFDITDINRWKSASDKKNKGKGANPLYTSNDGQIDVGFLEGKTLKHAFKLYPRVISAPKLPENFTPDPEAGVRQGLDVSEFTEDVSHEELKPQKDEFAEALNKVTKSEETATVLVNGDEPDFD